MQNYTLDSREVAEMIGKDHKDLLRDIRRYCEQLAESKIALGDFFTESTYLDSNNQSRPCYSVTKKGCEFISHKLTGRKGAEFTAQYINRFHKMEETIEQNTIDRSQLPVTMQIMYAMMDEQAKLTLKQQEQDKKIQALEHKQETIVQTFSKETSKDFRPWVSQCVSSIAESPNYHFIGTRDEKYQAVRKESYDRLNHKKPCRLKQRVESEKGRALNDGASTARVNAINKLTIIENDKALNPIYETVLKEMMIAYCVDTDIKNR